jgi:hypothetical protein
MTTFEKFRRNANLRHAEIDAACIACGAGRGEPPQNAGVASGRSAPGRAIARLSKPHKNAAAATSARRFCVAGHALRENGFIRRFGRIVKTRRMYLKNNDYLFATDASPR